VLETVIKSETSGGCGDD